jgi:hypothetical protein
MDIQMFEEKNIYIIILIILVFEKILLVKIIKLFNSQFLKNTFKN